MLITVLSYTQDRARLHAILFPETNDIEGPTRPKVLTHIHLISTLIDLLH